MQGSTNKVLVGSAKGYGYCPVYFTTPADADAFLLKIKNSNIKLDADIAELIVFSKSAMGTGYFKIGTEFGPVYISASKLNEELNIKEADLTEAVNDADITPTEEELKGNVGGLTFEEYQNAFFKD